MLFIVSGPGGVGKGTVVGHLLALDPTLWLSRSWTTRAKRPGEAENAYVFVAPERFEAHIAEDGFVEWTRFVGNGHLYGTPKVDSPSERDVLLEIELDGAHQVKRHYPDAKLIFIVAPSVTEQAERLRGRGDDEESIARRLEVGAQEEASGRTLADAVVVNDVVHQAAARVLGIINTYRGRPNQ